MGCFSIGYLWTYRHDLLVSSSQVLLHVSLTAKSDFQHYQFRAEKGRMMRVIMNTAPLCSRSSCPKSDDPLSEEVQLIPLTADEVYQRTVIDFKFYTMHCHTHIRLNHCLSTVSIFLISLGTACYPQTGWAHGTPPWLNDDGAQAGCPD